MKWDHFKGEKWKNTIDVENFIEENYTEYKGDESFLVGPTEKTKKEANEKQNKKYSWSNYFNTRAWSVNICSLFADTSSRIWSSCLEHIGNYHFANCYLYLF